MSFKVLYTADVHGNEVQYKKLVQHALDINANAVIIGGDIAPKGDSTGKCFAELKAKSLSENAFIDLQHLFFEKYLPHLVRPLKDNNIKLFLMMGNDDCSSNLDVLMQHDGNLFDVVHWKRLKLTPDFDIVGYGFVPVTPFGIKDWEKFDLSSPPAVVAEQYARRKSENYRLEGVRSTPEGFVPFVFNREMESNDSIQKDLAKSLFSNDAKKTVYVIHTPPNDTALDQIAGHRHVGSFAVRSFVERQQPYVTLHGHIHETVWVSGKFKEIIKNSVCLSPGNHNVGEDLAVLVFDLYNLRSVERRII
ncbi:metallophosphoesterase [Candidatus Woesearchaeota archaeon]|nr:metallophosphoesterase [Candidatus Woesearchaeota archaeon]